MKTNRYKVRFISGEEMIIKAKSSGEAWRKSWAHGNPTRVTVIPSRLWALAYAALLGLGYWVFMELSK